MLECIWDIYILSLITRSNIGQGSPINSVTPVDLSTTTASTSTQRYLLVFTLWLLILLFREYTFVTEEYTNLAEKDRYVFSARSYEMHTGSNMEDSTGNSSSKDREQPK